MYIQAVFLSCVYASTYVSTGMYVFMHICEMHASLHMDCCMHACKHVRRYICIMYVPNDACFEPIMYAYLRVCVYDCMHAFMCTPLYICVVVRGRAVDRAPERESRRADLGRGWRAVSTSRRKHAVSLDEEEPKGSHRHIRSWG